MGARLGRNQNGEAQRGDRIELIDFVSVITGAPKKSVKVPACLDELVEWTRTANMLINKDSNGGFFGRIQFKVYIRAESVAKIYRHLENIHQKHVMGFPTENAHNIALFYKSNVSFHFAFHLFS